MGVRVVAGCGDGLKIQRGGEGMFNVYTQDLFLSGEF